MIEVFKLLERYKLHPFLWSFICSFNHLDCLLKFQLMNYSEFRVMTTALEKYYKDVKIAILTGKRDAKDLDLRYTFRCNVPPL